VIGKYFDVRDAYKSIYESLTHAAASEDCGIDLELIDAESLQDGVNGQLKDVSGVLIPGGFGLRGVEEKSRLRVLRESTRFHISDFAWECRWQRLSLRETHAASKTRIAPSLTKTQKNR
jgi:CTP synthase (UTP-ammonia lyase)